MAALTGRQTAFPLPTAAQHAAAHGPARQVTSNIAISGILMEPLAWRIMLGILSGAIGFTFVLDQIKPRIIEKIKIE